MRVVKYLHTLCVYVTLRNSIIKNLLFLYFNDFLCKWIKTLPLIIKSPNIFKTYHMPSSERNNPLLNISSLHAVFSEKTYWKALPSFYTFFYLFLRTTKYLFHSLGETTTAAKKLREKRSAHEAAKLWRCFYFLKKSPLTHKLLHWLIYLVHICMLCISLSSSYIFHCIMCKIVRRDRPCNIFSHIYYHHDHSLTQRRVRMHTGIIFTYFLWTQYVGMIMLHYNHWVARLKK